MYDEGYYRYRESTRDFSIEAGLVVRMLEAAPGARVLEVGCGGGALLSFMRARGSDPTGSDLLPEAVRLAREAAPGCEVLEADAGRLPFPDASFDRLVSHHLVEHLPDLPAALAEWKRVLAPGGVMVICTPNRLYGSPRIFEDPSHLHIYDRRELVRMVEKAGFRVEESLTIFPHLLRDRVSVKLGYRPGGSFAACPGSANAAACFNIGTRGSCPEAKVQLDHALQDAHRQPRRGTGRGREGAAAQPGRAWTTTSSTPALACPSDGPLSGRSESGGACRSISAIPPRAC